MSDAKRRYSEASTEYREVAIPSSEIDQARYDRSKAREALYNENWKRNSVNINEVVSRFAPGAVGRRQGVKMVFEGERYEVRADMAAGYLRIYDKWLRKYVMLDGTPSDVLALTHFKVLRREEM